MTLEECQAALADARTQYHALRTGGKARVIVDKDGSRVEFASANIAGLYTYIQELELLCPSCAGTPMSTPRGPVGFTF